MRDADIPTGPAAAAILAAGAGSLALGVFALAADASAVIKRAFAIWPPSGPLSGVSTAAIVAWLAAWLLLHRLWRDHEIDLRLVNLAAFGMLGAALLLTFPPAMDWLIGR